MEYIAAREFFILDWNLMTRSENCVGAKIYHISFHQDALLFDYSKTKIYQEGTKNVDYPWHVYASPLEPIVCTVLALALYIILNPTILNSNCNIFVGNNSKRDLIRFLITS